MQSKPCPRCGNVMKSIRGVVRRKICRTCYDRRYHRAHPRISKRRLRELERRAIANLRAALRDSDKAST